jgi:hypothetical protein
MAAGKGEKPCLRRPRRRATYTRPTAVRHLLAGYDLPTALPVELRRVAEKPPWVQ